LNIKKSKHQKTNDKWFDKPFDGLTVLSEVEGLTTLSLSKGNIQIQSSRKIPLTPFTKGGKQVLTWHEEFYLS